MWLSSGWGGGPYRMIHMSRRPTPDLSALAQPGRILEVRVTPGARKNDVTIDGAIVRVQVTAPADRGAANDAVIRLLAAALGVAPSRLTLMRGGSSRIKTIHIDSPCGACPAAAPRHRRRPPMLAVPPPVA